MPFGTEERGLFKYSYQVHNDSWDDPNQVGVWFECTLADGGVRDEVTMDAIGQEIMDALSAAGFDVTTGSKVVTVSAPITPTP